MTMHWFRFYHEALDDPKVQKLDPATFKGWINLLCLACRHDGKLPPNDDIAFAMRMDVFALESLVDRLLIAGLIEVRKGGPNGSYIAPSKWDERQYKSDSSSERVKRYRQRSKSVSETPPDTDTEQIQNNPPNPPEGESLQPSDVVEAWNELADVCGLPKVTKLTDSRRRRLTARIKQWPEIESWQAALRSIHDNTWMHGGNDRGWRADFDFLLQDKSFTRLVEGTYDRAQ